MILDVQTLMSDQQSLAASAGSFNSTNVIDLGATGTIPLGGSPIDDAGRGNPIELFAQITQDVASGGAATVQFKLVNADDAALTTNPTTLWDSGAIGKATLLAGYQLPIRTLPLRIKQRYLGLIITVATATTTAGKLTAGIILDRQSNPTVG